MTVTTLATIAQNGSHDQPQLLKVQNPHVNGKAKTPSYESAQLVDPFNYVVSLPNSLQLISGRDLWFWTRR